MALPADEVLIMVLTVQDAFRLGENGSHAAGYALLLRIARRAQQAMAAGETWAPELAAAYREAAARYQERFPVAEPAERPVPEPVEN